MSASAGMNPEDVYRYSTRYLPTISIITHSTKLLREGKYDPNFKDGRAHDAKIIDDDLPREAAQLLMLDLEITQRNFKEHRVVIVSSPYRRCIETATIVAQEMGVDSIQIYYDFGEAVWNFFGCIWLVLRCFNMVFLCSGPSLFSPCFLFGCLYFLCVRQL